LRSRSINAVNFGEDHVFKTALPSIRYTQMQSSSRLRFDNEELDIRASSPVLARVAGSAQMHFVREVARVARDVFLSVLLGCPFPVENPTAILLLLHFNDSELRLWCGIAGTGFLERREEPHPHDPRLAGVASPVPRANHVREERTAVGAVQLNQTLPDGRLLRTDDASVRGKRQALAGSTHSGTGTVRNSVCGPGVDRGSGELEALFEQDRELRPGHDRSFGGILRSSSVRFEVCLR
jgi:hypothetical protein